MFPLLYVQRKFKLPLMGFNGGSRELEEGSHVILDTPSSTFVQLGLLFDISLIFLSILLFDAVIKVYTCATNQKDENILNHKTTMYIVDVPPIILSAQIHNIKGENLPNQSLPQEYLT